jgi:hypothetical protein
MHRGYRICIGIELENSFVLPFFCDQQRSLGRTAYARKDYSKSMEHW